MTDYREQEDGQQHGSNMEQTPLLQREGHERPVSRRPPNRSMLSVASITSIAKSIHVPKAHNGKTIVLILCGILLVTASANGFVQIPLTRIVENVICHQYYGEAESLSTPIDEGLCKVPEVQSKMAYLFAITEVTDAIAAVLAAFPWGIAADRLGRQPVVSIALTSVALSVVWIMTVLYFNTLFSPYLIVTSSLFRLIGGGNAILVGIISSMVSDVTPEPERATAFMRIHVSTLVGALASPTLASAMMTATGPWPAMWVGVGCLVCGAVGFQFVPETLEHKPAGSNDPVEHPEGFKAQFSHTIDQLKDSISILKSTSLILLLIVCLAVNPVGAGTAQFLVQFVSKRYGIPIQSTGYVQTAYGAAQIVQVLLVLPWISHFLMRDTIWIPLRMASERKRDLWLARWSGVILCLGFFVMAIAPSLWMFVLGLFTLALGSGAGAFLRSLLSLYVDAEHRSRLFSLVGMVEAVGGMYGPPMLAGLFSLGMKLGGTWIGLPYLGIAGIMAIVVAILMLVRIPKQQAPQSYEEARDHEA